jgi:hypothetical protein
VELTGLYQRQIRYMNAHRHLTARFSHTHNQSLTIPNIERQGLP